MVCYNRTMNGTMKAGTKYRVENEDGTLSEFFTSPMDRVVTILSIDSSDDPKALNVYQDSDGTMMYVAHQDEVA